MADRRDDAVQVHAESRAEWRAWLVANHQQETGAWLVTWKKATGRPRVEYEESVEEALCVGWVDSTGRALDGERTALWFATRKRGSGWARTNKRRIARLEAAGLLLPAGKAAVDSAKADGSWTLLDDVENLVVPPDLAAAFDAHPGSREQWDGFPPSARRGILEWIVQAKRPATRAQRIATTAEMAARGERANQWRARPS